MKAETESLNALIVGSNLEKETAIALERSYYPFFEQAAQWKERAEGLIVTDKSQVREMKMAREARLALKDIRVAADKKRKELKEGAIRYNKVVQDIYNKIEEKIKPIEEHLQIQENFAINLEIQRKKELKEARTLILEPLANFAPYNLDLGELSEEQFEKVIMDATTAKEEQEAAAAKAKKEQAEREAEAKRLREENEALKQKAIQEKAEREASERTLRAENLALKLKLPAAAIPAATTAAATIPAATTAAATIPAATTAAATIPAAQPQATAPQALLTPEEELEAQIKMDINAIDGLIEVLRAIPIPEMATKEGKEVEDKIREILPIIIHELVQTKNSIIHFD